MYILIAFISLDLCIIFPKKRIDLVHISFFRKKYELHCAFAFLEKGCCLIKLPAVCRNLDSHLPVSQDPNYHTLLSWSWLSLLKLLHLNFVWEMDAAFLNMIRPAVLLR